MKQKNTYYIQICPKCGSTDIHIDFSNYFVWRYGAPVKYACFSCGTILNFVPEIKKEDVKDFLDHLKRNNAVKGAKAFERVDALSGYVIGIYEFLLLPLVGGIILLLSIGEYFMAILFFCLMLLYISYLVKKKS